MSDRDELLGVMHEAWSDVMTAIDSDERPPDQDAGDGWRIRGLIAHVAP